MAWTQGGGDAAARLAGPDVTVACLRPAPGWRAGAAARMCGYGFTPREQAVGWELLRGPTNREIGAALGITERTVKQHLTVMCGKTYARNRLALALALLGVLEDRDD